MEKENGFAVTSEAYRYFLREESGVRPLPGGRGDRQISLNPDAVMKTTVMIPEAERAEAA